MLRRIRKFLRKGGLLFLIPHALPEAARLLAERKETALFFQVRPALEILHIFPVTGVYRKQPFHTDIPAFCLRRHRQLRLPVSRRLIVYIHEKSIGSAQGKVQILPDPFRANLAFFLQETAKPCQNLRAVLPLQKSRMADNGQPFTLFPLFP